MLESQSLSCGRQQEVENELFNRALNCLARREHSRKELHNKLLSYSDKYFSSSDLTVDIALLVERTLERAVSFGYIDDERFAVMYVRSRTAKGFGPMRIKAELARRGIDSDIIGSSLTMECSDQIERVVSGITGKQKWSNLNEHKVRAQISRHYSAKGYSFGTIRAAIDRVERGG